MFPKYDKKQFANFITGDETERLEIRSEDTEKVVEETTPFNWL